MCGALLGLALLWPAPLRWLNNSTLRLPLQIGDDSFLGHETVLLDGIFWAIASLFLLVSLHVCRVMLPSIAIRFRSDAVALRKALATRYRTMRWPGVIAFFFTAVVIVASVWIYGDAHLLALAETRRGSPPSVVVYLNRLGGGMNPVLVTAYFAVAGLLFDRSRLAKTGICMALAAGLSGVIVQVIKPLVGRSRPEQWLGAFHAFAEGGESFPSGHSAGAIALAVVAAYGIRSTPGRVSGLLLALAIGVARVLSFRHWPSDVVASLFIGGFIGWFFGSALAEHPQEADAATIDHEAAFALTERCS